MKNSLINRRWFAGFLFILLFFALCGLYSYPVTFREPPQSVHTWRQTNGLSMTQMYYQYDLPFFEPAIQNRISEEGLSGKTAGEFPVIYYVVAKIWKLLGQSEWSFRLVHLAILFAGLFLLFKMLTPVTGSPLRAGFIAMLVFTSPMIIFYGPNFLPDVPSLAFLFIAWYFLHSFVVRRSDGKLWLSALFFFLAIGLKITAGTSFLAIGSWVIGESLFLPEEKRIFSFRPRHFLPFVVSLLLVAGWYFYVDYYTTLHRGSFSHMGIWPVWKMTSEQFDRILVALDQVWFKEFFWPPLQYVTLAVWLFLLALISRLHPFFRWMVVVMPLGFLVILVLWFQVLEGHDYYLISQVQVLVVVWAIFFAFLKEWKWLAHPRTAVALILLFALLANNGRHRHKARSGWMNDGYKNHMEALTEIAPKFIEWNIGADDLVISIPDYSINASLYYMNRQGYTDFASDFSKEETFLRRIEQGAKFLVVNDTTILGRPEVARFAIHPLGTYRNIRVFDLRPFR